MRKGRINNPWGRKGKPKKRPASLGIVNNPWGRHGKPINPPSGFMEQVNNGLENFLKSPFKKGI
jgi:hypothetical protein|tara:strand:- start:2638 stop:2829 length:192 start_codon:yes stop_codon:yes gene_type:complete